MKRVYLDVCALCRPFDDQEQARIRAETTSIDLILSNVRRRRLELIVSPVHDAEIAAIEDAEERYQVNVRLAILGTRIAMDQVAAQQRTRALASMSFGVADAAHVALAEQANADFVSVDDKLLKKCARYGITVWCGTPLAYCDKEGLK